MTEEERAEKLAHLAACKASAEKAYDEIYEAHSSSDATACYSNAKEAVHDAIRLARELELPGEADSLHQRLQHIKSVFRSQFS